jgi:hypothetical protein
MRPCLEKPFTKIGLVEWVKVKTLSSSPSTKGKKKQTEVVRVHHRVGLALISFFYCAHVQQVCIQHAPVHFLLWVCIKPLKSLCCDFFVSAPLR